MKSLFLALGMCLVLSAGAVAAPAIYVAMPVYDFGSVVEGFAVSHIFVLKNVGDEVLEISGVNTQCGCTTTQLETTSIAPGASVNLEARVNTAGFHGTIAKTITVYSNDLGMPFLSLRITGQVRTAEVYNIAASDAYYYLYLLIDLRSAQEYEAHHILGAINIPYQELAGRLDDLPQQAFIILYDAAFESSEEAALVLRDQGFRTAYALVGGLDEWVRRYGMRFVTQAAVAYEPGAQGTTSYESGQRPQHLLLFDELYSIFLVFLDVRSPEDYAAGHIMGSLNVPFSELASMADVLPTDTPIVTYDQTGASGDQAALWLINNDFGRAQSLLGGLDEWIRQFSDTFLFTGLQ